VRESPRREGFVQQDLDLKEQFGVNPAVLVCTSGIQQKLIILDVPLHETFST
jgi:hypothetical protein